MFEILEDITTGSGAEGHLSLLEELASAVRDTTMCGLGQTAPNPVLSTLRFFRGEYAEHVEHKRCPAGVCNALLTFLIEDCCNGCGSCAKSCPEQAIRGESKARHEIDVEKCTRCGTCRSVCAFGAVRVV